MLPASETTPPWTGWVAGILVLTFAVCLAVIRFVPPGERLVVSRGRRVMAVRARGLVLVVPGVHRAARVPLHPARSDLLWLEASTADGVVVTVNATAVLVVRDAVAYAGSTGSPTLRTEAVAQSEICDHIARRDLADLAESTMDDLQPLAARVTARTLDWGVEFTKPEFTRVEVRLPHELIRWARTVRAELESDSSTVDDADARPPTGGVRHCVTRGGQHLGVRTDRGQRRSLLVYGPDQQPEQAIALDSDEADRIADLLHSHPVADRLAALERRVATVAGPRNNREAR